MSGGGGAFFGGDFLQKIRLFRSEITKIIKNRFLEIFFKSIYGQQNTKKSDQVKWYISLEKRFFTNLLYIIFISLIQGCVLFT